MDHTQDAKKTIMHFPLPCPTPTISAYATQHVLVPQEPHAQQAITHCHAAPSTHPRSSPSSTHSLHSQRSLARVDLRCNPHTPGTSRTIPRQATSSSPTKRCPDAFAKKPKRDGTTPSVHDHPQYAQEKHAAAARAARRQTSDTSGMSNVWGHADR
ncbi:hypothetical protein PSPO01_05161 [Paraphaeosphaeria sporulosa]